MNRWRSRMCERLVVIASRRRGLPASSRGRRRRPWRSRETNDGAGSSGLPRRRLRRLLSMTSGTNAPHVSSRTEPTDRGHSEAKSRGGLSEREGSRPESADPSPLISCPGREHPSGPSEWRSSRMDERTRTSTLPCRLPPLPSVESSNILAMTPDDDLLYKRTSQTRR